MKEPKPGQPISTCCNAIMYAHRSKCDRFIEFIYCGKCKRHIPDEEESKIYEPNNKNNMTKIKSISVRVTYNVGLQNIDAPKNVIK